MSLWIADIGNMKVVRSEGLVAVTGNAAVFWNVTSCTERNLSAFLRNIYKYYRKIINTE
jgi:hypothetical protein